MHLLLINIG